ncbi:pseudouridylate synthase RPUSD4, mitochondrial [Hyla sarda]|uniref:pseudouridylate synthase RPUSD4, mitochondrial n=1 Tax=Hyla sarda TaxID=327740 RepID=UPI0024C340B9|nr:pseudouridylate synthase RPUSD4, mitochondrial [Hyla sarda]
MGEAMDAEAPPPPLVLQDLRSWVVRPDSDLVLINKPPGLPTHGGPSVRHSVTSLLPTLSQKLFGRGEEPLRVCHRLDKDTSGALLLARSHEAAERIQRLMRERRVHRVYWAVCLGVPAPLEGIVDIPIMERETSGPQRHYKMSLCPRFRVSLDGSVQRCRVSSSAHEAVTRYRTLGTSSGAALLELHPLTGVKHQLRAHLALALNCPVLGDHKYSHWGRLAPQKLPPHLLRALALLGPQTRSLLLHLHAAQIVLPPSDGGDPIVLRCSPPKHFMRTLRKLQLRVPSLTDSEGPPEDQVM